MERNILKDIEAKKYRDLIGDVVCKFLDWYGKEYEEQELNATDSYEVGGTMAEWDAINTKIADNIDPTTLKFTDIEEDLIIKLLAKSAREAIQRMEENGTDIKDTLFYIEDYIIWYVECARYYTGRVLAFNK